MKTISNYIKTISAYQDSKMRRILITTYKKSHPSIKYPLWILTILVLFFYITPIFWGRNNFIENSYIFLTLAWGILTNRCVKSAFRKENFYKENKEIIESSNFDRRLLRYLIFKQELTINKFDKSNIDAITETVNIELGLQNNSIISNHPVTVICVGFLTAIIGGLSSQKEAWQSGVMIYLSFFIFLILFANYMFTDIIKTKAYQKKELILFLKWLKIDQISI